VVVLPATQRSTGAEACQDRMADAALKRRSFTSLQGASHRQTRIGAEPRTSFTPFHLIALSRSHFENIVTLCDRCHTDSPIGSLRSEIMDLDRTFFVTTVTSKRIPIFRVETRARPFINVLLDYRNQGKYLLHEFVVMPDHVHALITPVPEVSLERAMQFIKGGFSFRLRKIEKIGVWQESFTNHRIRDTGDYERHCEYIWLNPVRAGLVADGREYPFSSANREFVMDEAPIGIKPAIRAS
jgi:putative transposase